MVRQTNETIRSSIISLKKRGYTLKEISDIYLLDISSVTRILKRFRINGDVNRQIGSGRPIKHNIDLIIKQLLENDNQLTINQIRAILNNDHKIKYSRTQIYTKMKELGFVNKSPIIKPLLTDKHLNDREYWAIFYSGYNWNTVIWSDETTISIQPNKYSKIWIHKDSDIIKRKVKYPLKINIWGCMIKDHKLIIHIYDNTMNGKKYIDILKSSLLPLITKCKKKIKNKLIFQQDNAPAHTSIDALKFFSNNKIEVMFWPANSPDLNPIENVWNLLKNKIGKVYINTKEDLINIINKEIKQFDANIIVKLIDSMDNRIDELFSNNFDSINY